MTVAAWLTLLTVWFFLAALYTTIWVFALALEAAIGFVALGLTATWLLQLSRARRWPAAGGVLVGALIVAVVVLAAPWKDIYPRVWFATHRDAFVAAERMARSGVLGNELDSYMGAELPVGLRDISVNGNLSTTSGWTDGTDEIETECGSAPILFAPAWLGIPDGAIGFVHLACTSLPSDVVLDGYADDMIPRIRLGDGWWWAD